ncbi:MAG: hypothetical protein WCF84_22680 [Anaerolineae bacterium]
MSAFPVILDVAIGMVFIFLTLSGIVSTLNELVARTINMRGVYLAKGIIYLFCETEKPIADLLGRMQEFFIPSDRFRLEQTGLADYVLTHPLLTRLGTENIKFPRYIPGNDFAVATIQGLRAQDPLLHVTVIRDELTRVLAPTIAGAEAATAAQVQSVLDLARSTQTQVQQTLAQASTPEAQAQAKEIARAAVDELRFAANTILDDKNRAAVASAIDAVDIRALRQQVNQLPNEDLRRVLTSLLSGIDTQIHNVQDVTDRIETWFNNGMDRVSVLYKRRAQVFMLVIGALLCLLVNADALRLFNTLWHDPTLRAVLVNEAQTTAAQPAPGTSTPATGNSNQDLEAEKERIDALLSQIGVLPIGWNCNDYNQILHEGYTTVEQNGVKEKPAPAPICQQSVVKASDGTFTVDTIQGGTFGWGSLLLKLGGLIAMSVAVSFGAPFWFDLLNKLLSLRPDKPK